MALARTAECPVRLVTPVVRPCLDHTDAGRSSGLCPRGNEFHRQRVERVDGWYLLAWLDDEAVGHAQAL